MRKIITCLFLMLLPLSINIYSNELNLKGSFDFYRKINSDYVEEVSNLHGSYKKDLKPGLTLGGNYLINLKKIDFLIGPYINFSLKREVKNRVWQKYGAMSFGIMSKKYIDEIDENLYFLGGLGFNTLNEEGTERYLWRDLLVNTSTEGGLSYFIGGGYRIHDKLNLELLYQRFSGEFLFSGVDEYGRYSFREDITIHSLGIAFNYKIKSTKKGASKAARSSLLRKNIR